MIATKFVDASNDAHIPNEILKFSYCFCCVPFSRISKKLNAALATWCAPRRSCSQNIVVRNAFRALIREQHLLFLLVFKICHVFHHILRSCFQGQSPCNFWGDLPLRSRWLPGPQSGHFGPYGHRWGGVLAALAVISRFKFRTQASNFATEHFEVARCCPIFLWCSS